MYSVSNIQLRSSQIIIENQPPVKPLIQTAKPRCVSMYDNPNLKVSILDVHTEKYPTKRQVMSTFSLDKQKLLETKKYQIPELETFVSGSCKPMHSWQIQSFPSCNKLHETGLMEALSSTTDDDASYVRRINNGYFRDVWVIHDSDLQQTPRVLKTLRLDHDYIDRNYDRHRRDAVAMERLTYSPYIVNIYGYCGNNGLFEYSTGGDVDHVLFTKTYRENPLQKYDRLRIAAHLANGIADAHYLDHKGRATIAHTDITGGQFIFIDGVFKLNDFNRARFIRWNPTMNQTCGFKVGANRGDFRAPEEYEYAEENEKVDVYSMGNILYQLISLKYYLFGDDTDDEAIQKLVMDGKRPSYRDDVGPNPDEIDRVFISAMDMCYTHDPKERPSAREVANFLLDSVRNIPNPSSNETNEK